MEDQYESEELTGIEQIQCLASKLRNAGFKVKVHPRFIRWSNYTTFAQATYDSPERLRNAINRINNELLK